MKASTITKYLVSLLVILGLTGCVAFQEKNGDEKIIFCSNYDGSIGLYRLSSNRTDVLKIAILPGQTSLPTDNNGFLASPDGKHIAFASYENGNSEIYSLDVQRGSLVNLTKNQSKDGPFAWSPDSKYIAFVSWRDSVLVNKEEGLWTNDIYIMDADGANIRRLTFNNTSGQFGALSWSPDNEKLVFAMSTFSHINLYVSNIYVMDLNSLNISEGLLSTSDLVRGNPLWSPDGKHILYFESGSMFGNLYVMNADGSHPIALTDKRLGIVINAFWSPDGSQALMSVKKNGRISLYTVRTDGTALQLLTNGLYDDISPSWSPDGEKILFSSNRDGGIYQLYEMNANGTDQRRLINNLGDEILLAWLR